MESGTSVSVEVAELSKELAAVDLDLDTDDPASSDLVAVRPTENAGMGVFALRDIPRGTRISAEAPLVAIPPGPDKESAIRFCEALAGISPRDLARVDRHHCDPKTLQAVATTAIGVEILRWCEAHFGALTGSNNASSSSSPRPTDRGLQDLAAKTCRRYAIFLTNNLDTGAAQGRGFFHLFSRMNHSCAPNVFDHYNPSLRRLTSHALRDVRAGEQLFSHYIDLLMPRRARQRKLATWGFVCACPVCSSDLRESLRLRAIELDDMVEEFAEYADDPALWAADEKPAVLDAAEALDLGQKLVRLLRRQDLFGLELFNA